MAILNILNVTSVDNKNNISVHVSKPNRFTKHDASIACPNIIQLKRVTCRMFLQNFTEK